MLGFLLLVMVIAMLIYWITQHEKTKRKRDVKPPHRAYRSIHDESDEDDYESPLGLVDNPDDEWIEWAIMEDKD